MGEMRKLLLLASLALVAGCGTAASGRPGSGAAVKFDTAAAMHWVRVQVGYGPRPAGSPASRRLAQRLKAALPNGRFQKVPHGLRNVVGSVVGRDPGRIVVVGAHYDTKDIPGYLGAVDAASGTAVALQLAHSIRPRELLPTVVFVLFDGEESPPGGPPETPADFVQRGLRGSKVAARSLREAEAMVLLDLVGTRKLHMPRDPVSDRRLWAQLRDAAGRVGAAKAFPNGTTNAEFYDDHYPFARAGVPSIDLIDFDFPCWHRLCDTLSQVSPGSLGKSGRSVLALLHTL
jgi:glutaminyl-peptide cyclotransferase